jgi:hypothetical protein
VFSQSQPSWPKHVDEPTYDEHERALPEHVSLKLLQ